MRSKSAVALGVFILFCFTTSAQKTDTVPKTSGYISISFGAAMPVGEYASTVFNGGFGGYAAPGFSKMISGGLVMNRWKVGFIISGGSYNCFFKANNYLANIKMDTAKNFAVGRQGGDDWYGGGFGLLGLIFNLRLQKLNMDFKVQGGQFSSVFPELAYYESGTTINNRIFYTQYDYISSYVDAPGFALGFDARYSVTKRFCVLVNADFYYSQFFYTTIEQNTNMLAGNEVIVSLLNFTAGVGYQF